MRGVCFVVQRKGNAMGWDRKRRGPATGYYYQSVRTAAGVRKVYLGRSAEAGLAAATVEMKRAGRAAASHT